MFSKFWRPMFFLALALICGLVLIWGITHYHSKIQHESKLLKDIQLYGVQLMEKEQLNTLATTNQQYLKQVEHQGLDDLLKLIEISAILNVMQSSEIGVSFIADFNVTVGEVLKELNHSIKTAIEINLASVAVTKLIGLVARLSHFISPLILYACLGLWAVFLLFWTARNQKWVPQHIALNTRLLAKQATLIFVIFHLILPYSIHFSALISQEINHELHQNSSQQLDSVHSAVTALHGKGELKTKAKNSIHSLKNVSSKHIHKKTESLFAYLLWRLVLTLFDLIVMPLIIVAGLYFLTKGLLMRPSRLVK